QESLAPCAHDEVLRQDPEITGTTFEARHQDEDRIGLRHRPRETVSGVARVVQAESPPPNWVSSFGFVTTTPGLPGVFAGCALLGTSTVSCTTRVAQSFIASKLHASTAKGEAWQACRTTWPFAESTHCAAGRAPALLLPFAGFVSQHITRASAKPQ